MNHANVPMIEEDGRTGFRKRWTWVLALGIALTLLGLVGIGMVMSARASMVLFGVLLTCGGLSHGVQMLRVQGWRSVGVQALIALLYLFAAVLIFVDPDVAVVRLTLVLATFLIGVGTLRILGGMDARPAPGWGWVLAGGVVDVLLGVMVLTEWPISGLWVLGLFISIDLLVSGFAYVALAFQWRSSERGSLGA